MKKAALKDIIENKRREVAHSRRKLPLKKMMASLNGSCCRRDFLKAIKGRHNIIAEIKFRSPSQCTLQRNTPENIKKIISAYDTYASALSIVTDKKFFGGNPKLITKVKKMTRTPVLRKDFIIDPYQIYESAYYGADAILLIASLLSEKTLKSMIRTAGKLGMHCIVETSAEKDVRKAMKAGARIIGINNRDLKTMKVDLRRTLELKGIIPHDRVVVSESGIRNMNDILLLDTNAVLVGTSLLKAGSVLKKIRSLHRCKTKICGIRTSKEAVHAVEAGADILGFNFYPGSPRYVSPRTASRIISKLPPTVQAAGIFVNSSAEDIISITTKTGIDLVQLHGRESEKMGDKMESRLIRVCRISNRHDLGQNPSAHSENLFCKGQSTKCYALLLDTYSPSLYGGTGNRINPQLLRDFFRGTFGESSNDSEYLCAGRKVIIAGGLNPSNVREVLSFRPFCVDACSGVESIPGRKDPLKVSKFISVVRS